MNKKVSIIRAILKKHGVKPIGGITTISSLVKDPTTGRRYREYGRSGTVCKLDRHQRDNLLNASLTVYPAASNQQGSENGYWIVEL